MMEIDRNMMQPTGDAFENDRDLNLLTSMFVFALGTMNGVLMSLVAYYYLGS